MKKHSEKKIIRILHEGEGDATARDSCRKQQISERTSYYWRNAVLPSKRLPGLPDSVNTLCLDPLSTRLPEDLRYGLPGYR